MQAKTQKKVADVTELRARQSASRTAHDAAATAGLHLDDVDNYQKRHLFLAGRAAAREVQRDLERSEGGAVREIVGLVVVPSGEPSN